MKLHNDRQRKALRTLLNNLSPVLMVIFPDGPQLASTGMCLFWILSELRMMEVPVTIAAVRCAKLQSNCHQQQNNTQLFTGQMPFL